MHMFAYGEGVNCDLSVVVVSLLLSYVLFEFILIEMAWVGGRTTPRLRRITRNP